MHLQIITVWHAMREQIIKEEKKKLKKMVICRGTKDVHGLGKALWA